MRQPTSVASDVNLSDFSGLDGARWFDVDEFDAFNGQTSMLTFDRAFLDGITSSLRAIGDPAGPSATFLSVRADTADSVAFADPQNWVFDGLLAGDTVVQYRAVGTVDPLFLSMSKDLAAIPAYNFAGGTGDDTLVLPDMNLGAIDGGGGVDTLRLLSGSFDFTALGNGASVARFSFIDAGADNAANTITVDDAFATAAASGGVLTLIGAANDRAAMTDIATNWRTVGAFQDDPQGFAQDFVQYGSRLDGTLLNIQAELAQDLPLLRFGGAGDDVLAVEATSKVQTIDGAAGFDRLQPLGAGALDLTALAAGSTVQRIEALDLRGQGANAITLDDVFVAQSTTDHVLSVLGDAGDTLTLGGSWTKTGTFAGGGQTYDRWQAIAPAAVSVIAFVDTDVHVV